MDLEKLNAACSVVAASSRNLIVKLQELPVNVPKQILSANIVRTKFGESVLLELSEKVVFLPKRATKRFKPVIEQFNTGAYSVVYRGQQVVPGAPNPVIQFGMVDSKKLPY